MLGQPMWKPTVARSNPPCHFLRDEVHGTEVVVRVDRAGRFYRIRMLVRDHPSKRPVLVYYCKMFGDYQEPYVYILNAVLSNSVRDLYRPIDLVYDIGGVLTAANVPTPTPPLSMLN